MPVNAIVLAAGQGTRMKSRHAKVCHTILGKPLVWWSVDACRKAGAERIFVVVGHQSEEVRACLEGSPDIIFVEQTEQLGTGHAVKCVADSVDTFGGPVIICYGDSPLIQANTLLKMRSQRGDAHAAAVLLSMTPPNPYGYGRIILRDDQSVERIVEEKDATEEQRSITCCNAGVYVCCGRRLKQYIGELEANNAQHEFYLTDMVDVYNKNGEQVLVHEAASYTEALGVNTRAQLAEAGRLLQTRINAHWMSEGVSMWDPSQVWIGPEVTLQNDVELMPQTYLLGTTHVEHDACIGPNCRITNSHIGAHARIDESVVIDSQVDANVSMGPRAYIRPQTHICEGAHVGTHVEIKKSTIGKSSKVPHLSYIGDTQMGERVNIGAGSITCNYDGAHKHATHIGDDVFIGSDTMMVAPVNIGDGAITGASSCITRDVPAQSLALERSKQEIIDGYAARRREKLEKGSN